MSGNINAEVISIGTEILLGELTDTNSVFIARTLRDLGINLYFMTSVGDNEARIAEAIRVALSRAQVIITCGGLGPTVDDMTRQAVARATGRELVFHQRLLDQISARFAGYNVKMTDNNRRQAYLPDGALPVENPVGTAPCFIVEQGESVVISLPGVPREMKYLMHESILPYLSQRYRVGIIKARILKTAGIGESALDELLGGDLLEASNPTIGLAAHSGQIDVRITAKAPTEIEADAMIAEAEALVMDRAGRYIFGADGDRLEQKLVELLTALDGRLAVVQAGIGDALTRALRAVPDAEATLAAAEVHTGPQAVQAAYDIEGELPLRELGRALAQRVQEQTGALVSIVVLSNPDLDESADIAEGTVIVVSGPSQTQERAYGFGGLSDVARAWGTTWSLSMAWRMLREMTYAG